MEFGNNLKPKAVQPKSKNYKNMTREELQSTILKESPNTPIDKIPKSIDAILNEIKTSKYELDSYDVFNILRRYGLIDYYTPVGQLDDVDGIDAIPEETALLPWNKK